MGRPSPSPRRRFHHIVATSEHWWEDEEEFDAVTDALRSKTLVVVAAHPAVQAGVPGLREYLEDYAFTCGFCGSGEVDFAGAVWAGRDAPPLFRRMRRRPTLDDGACAGKFLAEILQQNWRLELDAGLGVAEPAAEHLLIVCSPAVAAAVAAVAAPGGELVRDMAVAVVEVGGTQAGDPADWERLPKRLTALEGVGAVATWSG